MTYNPALDLAPFGHWTLRDEAAQRRLCQTLGVMILNSRIALTFLLLLAAFDLRAETPWPVIASAIAEYAAKPSPLTARAAINAIPDAPASFTGSREEREANDQIYARGPMRVLERRVLKRERESVELAFRMRRIADGAFLEDLDIILGKLIRPAPTLFLTELQRANLPSQALDGLVGNLGDEYVDQFKRQCTEIRLRAKALKKVTEPSLQSIREQALSALQADPSPCNYKSETPNPSINTDAAR